MITKTYLAIPADRPVKALDKQCTHFRLDVGYSKGRGYVLYVSPIVSEGGFESCILSTMTSHLLMTATRLNRKKMEALIATVFARKADLLDPLISGDKNAILAVITDLRAKVAA